MFLLGLLVFFTYLYSVTNYHYMQKRQTFQSSNYSLKQSFPYLLMHFIFSNALAFLLDNTSMLILFSVQNTNRQKTPKRQFQPLSQ